MLFEGNDYNFDMAYYSLPGMPTNMEKMGSKNILSPYEGFLRGNMFKDEYDPYKNLTYLKLKPKTNQEKLLYEIMSLCFAINDLNLYLDLNPNDMESFNLLKSYIKEKNKLTDTYVNQYGPLVIDETTGSKYEWLNDWPWDSKRGDMYV